MALNQDLNSIVAYANSESVKINFKEFLLHTQNHPDCPTILAITDTLSFFNINGVMRLASSEIELLPERFIAFLKEENNTSKSFLAEIKKRLFCLKNRKLLIHYALMRKYLKITPKNRKKKPEKP